MRVHLGVYLSAILLAHIAAFLEMLFCVSVGVDVIEYGRVIMAIIFAPFGIIIAAFFLIEVIFKC